MLMLMMTMVAGRDPPAEQEVTMVKAGGGGWVLLCSGERDLVPGETGINVWFGTRACGKCYTSIKLFH